jgi:hypothetical protein
MSMERQTRETFHKFGRSHGIKDIAYCTLNHSAKSRSSVIIRTHENTLSMPYIQNVMSLFTVKMTAGIHPIY